MSLFLLSSAVASPWSSRLSQQLGTREAYASVQSLVAAGWLGLGLVVGISTFNVAFMLLAAPVLGALSGIGGTLSPILNSAYLKAGVARAYARRAVVTGPFAVAGALLAGALLTWTIPAVAIALNGLLTAPIALFAWARPPRATVPGAKAPQRPFRSALREVRVSRRLRPVVWFGVAAALFAMPVSTMVVPLLHEMRATDVLSGAGAVVAAVGAGKMLSPKSVGLLLRGRTDAQALRTSLVLCAALLALLGVSAALLAGPVQLAAWVLAAVGVGACLFSMQSLSLGAASNALGEDRSAEGIAAFQTVLRLSAPAGTLLYGFLLSITSTSLTLGVAALGALAATVIAPRVR